MPPKSLLAWLLLGLATLPVAAQDPLPPFDQLEADGAIIGEIRIDAQNVFDLDDPHENNFVFRLANRIHVTTRPWLIRRLLLFKSGERLSHRLIEETERVIRASSSVYDVSIRPVRYENGVVDLEVRTRDTWTLEPGAQLSRSGGKTTGGFNLKEGNLAGTGTRLEIERTKDVDRTGSRLNLGHDHLFDGWTRINFERASFNDGSSFLLNAERPFYSLDTRWAAGANVSRFDRSDSLNRNGEEIGEYRHSQHAADAYVGWSGGRSGRWTRRYSLGVTYAEDIYREDPAAPPPVAIPADRTLAGPIVRFQVLEDDYLEVRNRQSIQRAEYIAMGLQATLQLGRSLRAFGASEQPWQLNATVSKGFRPVRGAQLLTSAGYSAEYGSVAGDRRALTTSAKYYVPQSGGFLLFLGASADTVKAASAADELLLGGGNGLRGYPLRYQSGTRRALFTAEERYYTSWYPLRLFRVGWAVYYDVGRAWGGELPNATPGWLSNVGFGLRILSARASFGNVLHLDLAFPVHRTDPRIKPRQLVVMTGQTF